MTSVNFLGILKNLTNWYGFKNPRISIFLRMQLNKAIIQLNPRFRIYVTYFCPLHASQIKSTCIIIVLTCNKNDEWFLMFFVIWSHFIIQVLFGGGRYYFLPKNTSDPKYGDKNIKKQREDGMDLTKVSTRTLTYKIQ